MSATPAMTWTCVGCGRENPAGTLFCGYCGHPAGTAASPATLEALATEGVAVDRVDPPVEERRLITALFADISGFSALADALDPEELHDVVVPLISRLAAVGEAFGGLMTKYAGDAVLLVFGAPVAQEDHATRALLAAIEMHRALGGAEARLPSEAGLKVHIGLSSGRAISGRFGGELPEYSVLGDVVNVAQRLESAAPPGETYVAETTYRLARARFRFEPLGELALKGKSKGVAAWRLLVERAPLGEPPSPPPVGPLVGRARELAAASTMLDELREGRGGLFSIIGEPGIGKSRLTEEIRRRALGVRWLEGRCLSYGSAMAYRPYIDALRGGVGTGGAEAGAPQSPPLADGLARIGLLDALPYFARLLGLPSADPEEEAALLSPPAFRRGLHVWFTKWLRVVARHTPVVVTIEDIHWADASTIELTRDLAHLADDEPVAFLLTGRPEAAPVIASVADGLEEATSVRSIRLEALHENDVRFIVEGVLGAPAAPALVSMIADRTAGNPFFAEEMVRSLLDAGTLRRAVEGLGLDYTWDPDSVPPTIEGVLSARIDRLPPSASKVLGVASIIGRRVRMPLLRAVATDVPELEDALECLVGAALLDRLPPNGEEVLVFHHALVVDVAYARQLRRHRRELHRRVAAAGEGLYGSGDDVVDFLARHLYLAGEAKAIDYLLRAAERSKLLFANLEAITQLQRALELVERVADPTERARQELKLQVALAAPLVAIKGQGAEEVEHLCTRARELCREVGGTGDLFPVLFALVGFHLVRGELGAGDELGAQLVAAGEQTRDQGLRLVGNFAYGMLLYYRGELARAREHFERGIAIYRPEEHSSLRLQYVFDPGVGCWRGLAMVLCLLGHPDQAVRCSEHSLSLARAIPHPYGLAGALLYGAVLHQYRREPALALEQAEAAIAVSTEHSLPLWSIWATIVRGWALIAGSGPVTGAEADRSDLEQSLAELDASVAAYAANGGALFGPYWLGLLAETCWRVGEAEEGLARVAEALAHVEETGERSWEAELHRLRGELLLSLSESQWEEAERSLRRAMDAAARQGAKWLELRAGVSLGGLLQRRGRWKEARAVVEGPYGCFSEGFETEDLQAAEALLRQVTPRGP